MFAMISQESGLAGRQGAICSCDGNASRGRNDCSLGTSLNIIAESVVNIESGASGEGENS
jgi:hypothetical protein